MPDRAQVVNTTPQIGHNNPPSRLDQAAQDIIETGVLLVCKEMLVTAISDRRLERKHLRVLATIVRFINGAKAKAWPSRDLISFYAGMSPRVVSNAMSELKKWGYLIAEKEAVDQAGGRRLTVYSFGNIDHDGIRDEITRAVEAIALARDKKTGTSAKFTASGDPQDKKTSPPAVKVTPGGESPSPHRVKDGHRIGCNPEKGSSPPAVPSNLYKELSESNDSESANRGHTDFFDDDPDATPPKVVIHVNKSGISFKPLGHPKFEPISNQWIEGNAPNEPLSLVKEFMRLEIESFFTDPPPPKDGKPVRLLGFIVSGLKHRYPAWKERQNASAGGSQRPKSWVRV